MADRKAFTGGSNPHTTLLSQKILRISCYVFSHYPNYKRNTAANHSTKNPDGIHKYHYWSYPHPMIPISSNSTNLLLSKTPLQKMTKHKIVFLINSQIESSPESSNPHSIPVVPIDINKYDYVQVNSHHQPDAHTIYRLYIIHSHGFPSILAFVILFESKDTKMIIISLQ